MTVRLRDLLGDWVPAGFTVSDEDAALIKADFDLSGEAYTWPAPEGAGVTHVRLDPAAVSRASDPVRLSG